MTGLIMFLHALVAVLLIVVILMQAGRGGGLTEGFASAESIFGAQTNEFMIKTTTVLATIFFVTCIGLAILSSKSGRSLMSNKVATEAPIQLPPEPAAESVGEQPTGQAASEQTQVPSEIPQAQANVPEPETPPPAEPVPAAPVTP